MTAVDIVNDSQDAVIYREIDGQLFRMPNEPLPILVDAAGNAVAIEDDDALQQSRQGWPRHAKLLPRGAEKVTYSALITTMRESESDRAKDLRYFLQQIIDCARQTSLEIIPENRLNVTQRLRPISEIDVERAARWEFDMPMDWREIPDILPEPMPAPLLNTEITVLSRNVGVVRGNVAPVIPAVVPGLPQQDPQDP